MSQLKSTVVNSLQQFSRLVPLKSLLMISGQPLFCPFYHTISNDPLPHIDHLYQKRSVAAFIADLDFLTSNFQPLDYSGLVNVVNGAKALKEPHFFLSFDDGLVEVYKVIAPILTERQIPATVFLNSAFVDNIALMFRYKASLLIDRLQHSDKDICLAFARMLKTKPDKSSLKAEILKLTYADQPVLDQLAEVGQLDFEKFLQNSKPYLTTAQISKLTDTGFFSFASHSVDHPLFSGLTEADGLSQIAESLAWLEQQAFTSEKAFAFPFTDDGVGASFFESAYGELGLELSFGTAGLKKPEFAGRHIHRFPMEGTSLAGRQMIKGAYLYYLVKAVFGKARISR
ncbi:MAG: polysaccharide deacetylase family protein [Bacteroidota bacterium]